MAEQESLVGLFLQIGILENWKGQGNIAQSDIIGSKPDDKELILEALRGLYKKGLVTFDKSKCAFDFSDKSLRLDELDLHFGPKEIMPIQAKSNYHHKPQDIADHSLQHMAQQHAALEGKPYSNYSFEIQTRFNATNELIDQTRVQALGCFLWAYKKVTGQDLPIPGSLTDKKYWGKIAAQHLDNYPLSQLEPMYLVAIKLHLDDGLSLYTPDSISKKLIEAYQILAAKAKAKQQTNVRIQQAIAQKENGKSYEDKEAELIDKTLHFASGKSGELKNSSLMWRGYIFGSEQDMHAVLNKYQNWKNKIDMETESEIRALLAKGELVLEKPLEMSTLDDLFHFRTVKEDKFLFAAYVFTQRATNPNFNPLELRLEKSIPLSDDLETCPLPDFYQKLHDETLGSNPAYKFLLETGQIKTGGEVLNNLVDFDKLDRLA